MNEKQQQQTKELLKALLNYTAQELATIDYDGDEVQPMFHVYVENKLLLTCVTYHSTLEVANKENGITISVDLDTRVLNEKEIINIMHNMY